MTRGKKSASANEALQENQMAFSQPSTVLGSDLDKNDSALFKKQNRLRLGYGTPKLCCFGVSLQQLQTQQ